MIGSIIFSVHTSDSAPPVRGARFPQGFPAGDGFQPPGEAGKALHIVLQELTFGPVGDSSIGWRSLP
jgi:hypothetical protein